MKNNSALKIATVSQILAVGFHGYLTLLHYGLQLGTVEGKSICSINNSFNCESVALSPYSVFAGVPLALWGVVINGFLLLFLFGIWSNEKNSPHSRWSFLFSVLTIVGSLVMATISLLKMNTYCLFCIGLYILSFVTFFCLLRLKPRPRLPTLSDIQSLFSSQKGFLIAILLIPTLVFLLDDMNMREVRSKLPALIQSSLDKWENSTVGDTSAATKLSLGAPEDKARFIIYEFADFQCIHCKAAASPLHAFTLSKSDVRFNFVPFPIFDQKSQLLSKAALCAEKSAKGWDVHDWIFDNFGVPEKLEIEVIAQKFNLNFEDFKACVYSDEMSQQIQKNLELGKSLKIEGTPAIFVNGKILQGGQIIPILEALHLKISN